MSKDQNQDVYEEIKKKGMVWKFCFYGFFKNLKFFEPYLLIIFLALGFDLLQWGVLMMIQEVLTYLLEVPSGVLADKFGKKMVLMMCFIFYIISFVFYFIGMNPDSPNLYILVVASVFFGLGESFRSGTHKAMELVWMERNEYLKHKTFIYGRTRSYSLIGSALSGILSVVFLLIIQIPPTRTIFLLTIVPYIVDFFLIASYPSYMNEKSAKTKNYSAEFMEGFKQLKIVFKNRKLGKALFSSATFDGIYKTLKDYIQPIMKLYFGVLIAQIILNPSQEQIDFYIPIILGLTYTLFYIISSFTSKNAYKFNEKFKNSKKSIDIIFDVLNIVLLLIGVFIFYQIPIVIILLYLVVYMSHNLRRPIVVDYLSDIIDKEQRATILSVESLLKSLLVFIFAPLFGLIAEATSIAALFVGIAIVFFIINRFFLSGDCNPEGKTCED